MNRFPKDCWGKNCPHFHTVDMSIDDLLCACDILQKECDACDEDYGHMKQLFTESEQKWQKPTLVNYMGGRFRYMVYGATAM